MTIYTYRTRPETLLVLAWCSTLDLRALLEKDQQEHSWKYPHLQYRQDWRPAFPADLLHKPLAEAFSCFRNDPYGPALRSLVDYRLLFVDIEHVAHTLSLKDLADPSHGLFYSDDPFDHYTIEKQLEKGPANETDAFWQAISQSVELQNRLHRLSETWQNRVCQGARALQTFFLSYLCLARPYQNAPFFVRELLLMSLERVNWHAIAANLLLVEPPPCTCARLKKDDSAVQVVLFKELLRTFGDELRQVSERLPDPSRGTALRLSDSCERASIAPEASR
ncbi:MAG: hypothetical protein H0U76_22090 [Ktedonobacteraceae bacterium]|nr:hypothetical protein [Ktedonobacteraceae bacterium]